jgi:thiamine transporter
MSRRGYLQALVETAVMVGLAMVLDQITLFRMPQGGSVTAGSMIPILLIALRHGTRWGVAAGVVFGMTDLFLGGLKDVVHPMQLLLDFPVAFGMLGLAGLAHRSNPFVGGALSGLALVGRFLAHVVSGVIFFGQYAPEGQNAWVYSAVYNGSYMLPEMLISGAILLVLHPALRRALPPRMERAA